MVEAKINTIRSIVNEINFIGCSLLSINDLTDDQIYGLFDLALVLEPFSRSMLPLVTGNGIFDYSLDSSPYRNTSIFNLFPELTAHQLGRYKKKHCNQNYNNW